VAPVAQTTLAIAVDPAVSTTPTTSATPSTSTTPVTSSTPPTLDPLQSPAPNSEINDALKKSQYFNNSIFWIEVEKIVPNPYQPRKEFDQHALRDLADSIRMYGLLQPLVVTRKEITKEDGGLAVRYELISGERRLRASKLSGLLQVPVIIRAGEEDARVKLELAIIENLQREDLNPVDRARSFQRLSEEFGLKHAQIAEKMGKSREYVTNSIRLLALPPHMLDALSEKKISEGHTRPLLMLADRPEEQEVLFREITLKKMTVREAERIARGVAVERVRKHDQTPELKDLEKQLNQAFGTRVFIEKKEQGGKVVIDFFNVEDVRNLIDLLNHAQEAQRRSHTTTSVHSYNSVKEMMNELSAATPLSAIEPQSAPLQSAAAEKDIAAGIPPAIVHGADAPIDDSSTSDIRDDEEIYSIKNFSI
jgi:ParB family transcriptional regulator, chromosome partitioning protein